jgi:hypothetical protein
MKTYSDPERRQAPGLAFSVIGSYRVLDRQDGTATAGGVIGLIIRRTPERHHAVTDIFVDGAILGFDAGVHQGEMFVQQISRLGRRHLFRHRGEPGDIGEHQGDLALLRRGGLCALRAHNAQDQAFRHIGLELSKPFDHSLKGHPRLVELAYNGASEIWNIREIKLSHRVRGGRELKDRAADAPRDQDQRQQGRDHKT